MSEIWRDIEGYEGKYQVSNLGNVKSLNYRYTGKEGVLKAIKDCNGYLYVNLYKNRNHKKYIIHRLVASAFIENPNCYPEVNHKDEVKTNNRVENLEWCDRKYNVNYGTFQERKAKAVSKALSKKVYQYTIAGELVKVWDSTVSAEREQKYNNQHISACCLGKLKTHKGFIWRYEPIPSP